jgi:hypothetical protein
MIRQRIGRPAFIETIRIGCDEGGYTMPSGLVRSEGKHPAL